MLPVNDDGRCCVGYAVLALVQGEVVAFLKFQGQFGVALDAALAENLADAVKIVAGPLPTRRSQARCP
jgi:hypothetical protein